jgi:hypothetical protein
MKNNLSGAFDKAIFKGRPFLRAIFKRPFLRDRLKTPWEAFFKKQANNESPKGVLRDRSKTKVRHSPAASPV